MVLRFGYMIPLSSNTQTTMAIALEPASTVETGIPKIAIMDVCCILLFNGTDKEDTRIIGV